MQDICCICLSAITYFVYRTNNIHSLRFYLYRLACSLTCGVFSYVKAVSARFAPARKCNIRQWDLQYVWSNTSTGINNALLSALCWCAARRKEFKLRTLLSLIDATRLAFLPPTLLLTIITTHSRHPCDQREMAFVYKRGSFVVATMNVCWTNCRPLFYRWVGGTWCHYQDYFWHLSFHNTRRKERVAFDKASVVYRSAQASSLTIVLDHCEDNQTMLWPRHGPCRTNWVCCHLLWSTDD